MSWFDWFVTGSFWLMGLATAIGVMVTVLQEIREPAALKGEDPMEENAPREPGEPNDNVLDLRVARWRHDPFITEMLEIIEKLSRYDEIKKWWVLIRVRNCLRAAEEEAAKGAKLEE